MSAGLSGAFAARGVGRGDVVMTLVGNRLEWVLSLLACWRMGAVALPCNTQLRRRDLELRAGVADPTLCVGEEDLLGELPDGIPYMTLAELAEALDEDLPQAPPVEKAELDPEDPALVVFTSGSTGEPRAALHAQRYLPGQRRQAEHWLGAREQELVWCTTATGWSKSARNVFLAPWLCGAAAMLADGRFEPAERLALIERERVNVVCQAPTEYRALASRAELRPLPSVRRLVSAGEPLNPEVIASLARGDRARDRRRLRPDRDRAPGRQPRRRRRSATARWASRCPGSTCGSPTRSSSCGSASCPTFFSRYLDGEPFAGEWWSTGDVVRADDDGYLWFEGRDDDLILSAGYRIGPFEVESALLTHPAVAEAAAVAAPDAERGSVVRAIVVPRDRAPSDELARELQEHVKAHDRALQVPADRRVRRASCRRQPAARSSARSCAVEFRRRDVGSAPRP